MDTLTTLREMFAVCANERRMQEADALADAIDRLAALPKGGPVAWFRIWPDGHWTISRDKRDLHDGTLFPLYTHPPAPVVDFDQWYVENAFNYEAAPLGSRDCALQRKAWNAALEAQSTPAQPEISAGELDEHACVSLALEEAFAAFYPDIVALLPEPLADALATAAIAELTALRSTAQPVAQVDEAMVERALNAWCDVADVDEWRVRNTREALRAALTAALAPAPGMVVVPRAEIEQLRRDSADCDYLQSMTGQVGPNRASAMIAAAQGEGK